MVTSRQPFIARYLFLGILIFFFAISCIYLYPDKSDFNEKKLSQKEVFPISSKTNDETKFIEEGKLTFLNRKTKKTIIEIDIEIADAPYKRTAGLMYRRSLPTKAGMLFIYEQSKPRFFWMKNTYISLDIIYVNENMQIVTIQKNQKPLSEKPISSYRDSMYVVEVNAGFCDKYGINIGDYINFKR